MRKLRNKLIGLVAAFSILSGGTYALPVPENVATAIVAAPAAAAAAASGMGENFSAWWQGASDSAGGQRHGSSATVKRVVDGDTIVATTAQGEIRVRILSIDTPESTTTVERGGVEASNFAKGLLTPGLLVTLSSDPSQADFDRYDRALRHITLPDGRDYATTIAAAGWVAEPLWYGAAPRNGQAVESAIAQAQAANLGMWALC